MDNNVIKRIKITYGIFTSLLLVSLLCLALCSLLLVYSSDNIAYASSLNGIVEDNLLLNVDMKNGDNIGVNYSGTVISSYDPLVFSSEGTWGYIRQLIPLSQLDLSSSYTLTAYVKTENSSVPIYVGLRTFNNSSAVSGFSITGNTTSTDYVVVSCTVNFSNYSLGSNVNNLGCLVYSNGNTGANNKCYVQWMKLEKGSSFTGFVPKDYSNYGYNQGVHDGSNSTAYINSGYILDKSLLLSDLENGSTFTINNINYRFQGSTVLDNYFQTNVINSWPLGANGDTNHRYLGFLIADDLYKFSAIQISIIRDGAGYLYFSGDGLTPKVVDLSSLSPVSSYPFNYLNQSTYMDTFVIYASEFTNVYYLSYLDTSSSSAGDTVFFNTINLYSNLDNSSWYDRGIETGKTLGYSEGYNKGYQEGSDYSGIPFYNMFGAIFDVPVQTINGLLDFNILGVNMKGFILGLISLCIILFILKIVFK